MSVLFIVLLILFVDYSAKVSQVEGAQSAIGRTYAHKLKTGIITVWDFSFGAVIDYLDGDDEVVEPSPDLPSELPSGVNVQSVGDLPPGIYAAPEVINNPNQ